MQYHLIVGLSIDIFLFLITLKVIGQLITSYLIIARAGYALKIGVSALSAEKTYIICIQHGRRFHFLATQKGPMHRR